MTKRREIFRRGRGRNGLSVLASQVVARRRIGRSSQYRVPWQNQCCTKAIMALMPVTSTPLCSKLRSWRRDVCCACSYGVRNRRVSGEILCASPKRVPLSRREMIICAASRRRGVAARSGTPLAPSSKSMSIALDASEARHPSATSRAIMSRRSSSPRFLWRRA